MGLPKLEHPTFVLTLPSTQQSIEYRPFLVKEEKILLIAQSANDISETLRAIKQVISNCITTPNVDINTFTTFDLEYFFLKLRSKSVNNVVSLSYRDSQDDEVYTFDVDLEDIEVTMPTGVKPVIQVNDSIGIKLRYPTVNVTDSVSGVDNITDFTFELMKSCIDVIFTDEEVFKASDYTPKEIEEFLDDLDVSTFDQIQAFFNDMPKIEHVITYTNKQGNERKITLNGLQDFFALG